MHYVTQLMAKDITFMALDLMTHVNRPAVQKKLNRAVQNIIDEIREYSASNKRNAKKNKDGGANQGGKSNEKEVNNDTETSSRKYKNDFHDEDEDYDDEDSEEEEEEEEEEDSDDECEASSESTCTLDAKQLQFLKRLKISIDGPRAVDQNNVTISKVSFDQQGRQIVNEDWVIKYTVRKGIFAASMEDVFTVVGGKITKLTRRKV